MIETQEEGISEEFVRNVVLPLVWWTSKYHAYSGGGKMMPVFRKTVLLKMGGKVIGGYEVDEGHENKGVKAFVMHGSGQDRRKFPTEEEARNFLMSHAPE